MLTIFERDIAPVNVSVGKDKQFMQKETINNKRQFVLNQLKDNRDVIDLTTTGSSMEPLIKSNSIVYIEFTHMQNISIGDVIAFYDKYGVSIHRCIGKKANNILERGDGCNLWTKCNWITCEDVIGKMIYLEYEDKRLVIESLGYKIYSFFIILIGKLSNQIGCINSKDATKKPHISLSKQNDLLSKLINRFILLLYKIFIDYEKMG